MKHELKQQIVDAANAYIKMHSLSNNEVSRKADINAGYLSPMLKGEFTTTVNNKPFEIPERWFFQLAKFIAFEVEKTYCPTVLSTQFKEVIFSLGTCKRTGRVSMIICSTGMGKSYAVDQFCNQNPHHTYKITVSSLYTLDDVLEELSNVLGCERYRSRQAKLKAVIEKLRDIKMNGGKPVVIVDEAENLDFKALRALKALFDGVKDFSSLVLIGTDILLENITNTKRNGNSARNRNSLPQLHSRFKLGRRDISPLSKERDFPLFYKEWDITDNKVIQLAYDVCDSYRDLNNFFEPVLREADEKGIVADVDLYRKYHNIPNLKRV